MVHFITGVIYSRLRVYRESYHFDFLYDQNASILYLSTKFELDLFINNGDLLSDKKNWKHKHTHIRAETDTLPIYHIWSSNESSILSRD